MAIGRTLVETRPMATPVPGATWSDRVLDAADIAAGLNRLWARLPESDEERRRATTEEAPGGVLTRASTLNLTAVARSRADAARVEQAVVRLGELYPSRATILVADPDKPASDDAGLEVRAAILEQPSGRGRGTIRFERVTVEVGSGSERQLASIASPLLVADLPDFLWWAADSTVGSDLFADLIMMTDRVIVDTAAAPDPAAELRSLSALLDDAGRCPKLSDFAWTRLAPWRQLVAQFFDQPRARAGLDALDEVHVVYGAADSPRRSGLTGALLFAGWLCSRLNWTPPGELVRERGAAEGWRATLRAGARGQRRELLLTVQPAPVPVAGCGLAAVTLVAAGIGQFRVERFDPDELATHSQVSGLPTVRRLVFAALPDDASLLADELRNFDRDPVYEAALVVASGLTPAGPGSRE